MYEVRQYLPILVRTRPTLLLKQPTTSNAAANRRTSNKLRVCASRAWCRFLLGTKYRPLSRPRHSPICAGLPAPCEPPSWCSNPARSWTGLGNRPVQHPNVHMSTRRRKQSPQYTPYTDQLSGKLCPASRQASPRDPAPCSHQERPWRPGHVKRSHLAGPNNAGAAGQVSCSAVWGCPTKAQRQPPTGRCTK